MKYRVIELFSGVGAQRMALKRIAAKHPEIEFEFLAQCDIDKHAINSYNAIHGETMNLGDISKVERLPDCDILTYSFPCFTQDTLIQTTEGWKEIVNVKCGDIVQTHDGWKEVECMKKTGTKKTVTVIPSCGFPVKCTPEHLFYARKMYRKWNNQKHNYDRLFYEPEWVMAKDLTREHYLGFPVDLSEHPIPEWNGIEYDIADGRHYHKNVLAAYMDDPKFWYIVGRYIADGWTKEQGIVIGIGKGKEKDIEKMADLNKTISYEKTCMKVHISIKELRDFCSQFGEGAINKHIPEKYIHLPKQLAMAMLNGYLDGDGCLTKNNNIRFGSISKSLIMDIQRLVAYIYNRPTRININLARKNAVIEGRKINTHDYYEGVFHIDSRPQDRLFYEDGWVWGTIRSVKENDDAEDVFDICVKDSHSFIANGIAVHNCTDLSQAGLKEGMEKGSGTRSALVWEVLRVLENSHKPEWLVMENVPAITFSANIKSFNNVIRQLAEMGYTSRYAILNATEFNVAQNRSRCFMVSHYHGPVPEFPKGPGLSKCLLDYMEKDVDPKFYLSKERLKGLIVSCEKERERGNGFGNFSFSKQDGSAKTITTREGNVKVCNYINTDDTERERERERQQ